MPKPSVTVLPEFSEDDLAFSAEDTAAAGETCFSGQVRNNKKFYTKETRTAFRNKIVSVRGLLASSRETLTKRISKAQSQAKILQTRIAEAEADIPDIIGYMELSRPVNEACQDTSSVSLEVNQSLSDIIAERRELEYRLFLATKVVNQLQKQYSKTNDTLTALDNMALALDLIG